MKKQISISRFLYPGFILFGVYFAIFRHDYANAGIYFGIALAFDPFDVNQPWNERPVWQKAILLTNLALTAALIGYEIGFGDKV